MYSVAAYIHAILLFCVSSVGMMLSNKLAVTALPLPCTLVLLQMFATLALLLPFRSNVEAMTLKNARAWIPVASLFAFMLYTSMKSFVYANVPTLIIIRNLGSIVTTVAEYYVLCEGVNAEIILAQVAIFCGAVVYGWTNSTFSVIGLVWMLANVVGQGCYGILVKHMTSSVPGFVFATKYTLALYNNVIAIPAIFLLFVVEEQQRVGVLLPTVVGVGWFWIGVTCVLGFMISTSGFALQKLVSAATFIVINNLTKFLNILIGLFILHDRMGLADGAGCVIALVAGAWYSAARYRFKTPDAEEEKKVELPKEESV
ncbi:putative GDP-mannose transporter [Trypanosoma conorhini]|uniref:Putative GDP-mannose transporter n=1 Tax=Trypanosoma conorhini TaxID=83891 RepID=A0A3R7MIX2_9TRYP|nr:putative GDP-mannose transporter [Trypanosoma conorhini]RNF06755.1 putative GDP-mannose transporter [Trypanosoma conorhini]